MVRYYGTHSDLGTGRLTITRNSLSLEEKGLFREQIAGTIILMQLHNGHHLNPQSIPPVFEEGSIIPPITRATENDHLPGRWRFQASIRTRIAAGDNAVLPEAQ